MIHNIPEIKPALIAVSRDRFVISPPERRRASAASGHIRKALFPHSDHLGIPDVSFSQPKSLLYKSETSWQ